jgi:RNA recognition motif-containing protein
MSLVACLYPVAVCVLSAETLKEYFEDYGAVKSVMLKEDRDTGKSR